MFVTDTPQLDTHTKKKEKGGGGCGGDWISTTLASLTMVLNYYLCKTSTR